MLCYVLRSSQQRSCWRRGRMFGNEPIGTALLWPPVLLLLTTALLASESASLASRAQRALYTYQGSRPIVTTCAANQGPSLGGSAMLSPLSPLSPSCRLAERPLNTYRFVYRLDHLGGTVSAQVQIERLTAELATMREQQQNACTCYKYRKMHRHSEMPASWVISY